MLGFGTQRPLGHPGFSAGSQDRVIPVFVSRANGRFPRPIREPKNRKGLLFASVRKRMGPGSL
jgi:hypothetical protein